jgi:uncharacterized membrane protein
VNSGDDRVARTQGGTGGRLAVGLAAVGALVFLAGTLLPATMEAAGLSGGSALRAAYHPLCHQVPSRSLSWAGHPLAVCSRCAGLYLGGALALLLAAVSGAAPRVPPGLRWLALAVAPTALDALVGLAGGTGLSDVPRLVISIPAGFVAGLYLAVGLADLGGSR